MKDDKPNILIITCPFDGGIAEIHLAKIIDILEPLSNEIYAITGSFRDRTDRGVHVISIKGWKENDPPLVKIYKYWRGQLKTSFHLWRISKNIDVVIFEIGAGGYVLPMVTAKLLGEKTIYILTSLLSERAGQLYGRWFFGFGGTIISLVLKILERINRSLIDQIGVHSRCAIDRTVLSKHRKKVVVNPLLYVDTDLFKIKKELKDRANLVGYVGRLSPEKGVMNFVESMPLILREHEDVEFLICGDGPLFEQIKGVLERNNLRLKTRLTGFQPYEDISDHMNTLKLMVVPSHEEGGPMTVVEAMGCGTPVLATSVGFVPDMIEDGQTGFILENRSPECIARNVIRAIEHPRLNEITRNARNLVEKEYSYLAIVEKCRNALFKLVKG